MFFDKSIGLSRIFNQQSQLQDASSSWKKKKKIKQGFFLIGNVVLDLHHIQIGIIKQLEMQIFFVYIVSLKEVSLF